MPDGQTYEREAIAKALKASPFSPLTKKPLNMKDAVPNYALKSMIEKYLNSGENPLNIEQPQKVDLKNEAKVKSFKAEVVEDPDNNKNVFVNLSLEPEKMDSRKPLVLIAMIDVSGSMQVSSSQEYERGRRSRYI